MNDALLQAADSRTNEEEKNRELYKSPCLKKFDTRITMYGHTANADLMEPES